MKIPAAIPLLFFVTAIACAAGPRQTAHPQIDSQQILSAIERTGNKMILLAEADGRFVYRFHLDPAKTFPPRYNMLRHAGAVYALRQYQQKYPGAQVETVIQNAVHFMKHCCTAPIKDQNNPAQPMMAIWPFSTNNSTDADSHEAKLGGAGLGLVAAAIAFNNNTPGPYDLTDMQQLGEFIRFMQKPNGSFYSKYLAETQSRDNSWTSLYYPGEAALGLLYLYDLDNDTKWLHSAVKALRYLATSRKGKTLIPHDHWALIATQKLFASQPMLVDAQREMLLQHAIQQSHAIMNAQITDPSHAAFGAFDSYGKTTPAATRIEGLVAAYQILPDSEAPLKKQLLHAIEIGVSFLLTAQVTTGPNAGVFPRALYPMPPSESDAADFNVRMSEVRIDYLQHALSAMLGYLQIREGATQN